MKYKIGDKIKIKSIDWYNHQVKDKDGDIPISSVNYTYFTKEMSNFCGKEAKIVGVSDNYYTLDIDKGVFEWIDVMFEDNYIFEELPIGEVFDFKGHKLRVEKDVHGSCAGCFMLKNYRIENCCAQLFQDRLRPRCGSMRKDRTGVIFKEIENMEKRKVELDIETAKKWYNGSDKSLHTLALQAFSENELKDSGLPNTWNEFCLETPIKQFEYYISADSGISQRADGVIRRIECDKNVLPNKKSAESILALCQLTQLRDRYRQGWVPNLKNNENKYIIDYVEDNLYLSIYKYNNTFLSFQSKEIRDLFVKNFKDLIELAKEYI